jgi:hypothetical protein
MLRQLQKLVELWKLLEKPVCFCHGGYLWTLNRLLLFAYDVAGKDEDSEIVRINKSPMCEHEHKVFYAFKQAFETLPVSFKKVLDKIVKS